MGEAENGARYGPESHRHLVKLSESISTTSLKLIDTGKISDFTCKFRWVEMQLWLFRNLAAFSCNLATMARSEYVVIDVTHTLIRRHLNGFGGYLKTRK